MRVHLSAKVPNEGARRLVRWMMRERMSLTVLAERAGISAQMVVRMIEDGLVPAAGTIERIAGISGGFVRGWTKPARGWWFERPASAPTKPWRVGSPPFRPRACRRGGASFAPGDQRRLAGRASRMMPARGESERPRYAIGPLGDAIDVASLEEWLRAAVPGDRIVYAWGAVLRRDRRAVTRAAELGDAGRVQLNFRKIDGRGEWVATRLTDRRVVAVPPAPPMPGAATRAPETAEERVFRAIRRRVRDRLAMATDAELARECGLKDADQASYVLRKLKLEEAGHRRIRILRYGPRERRVAVIVATGGATVRTAL